MNAPLIIVRGASGAGKSTFANMLKKELDVKFHPCGAAIFETDNFFIDQVMGFDYKFDPKYLGAAHAWNQAEVIRFLRDYNSMCPVIVANTFCKNWEIKPYLQIAKDFNRPVYAFTLRTEHDDNVHCVPKEKVEQMRLGLQDFDMKWLESECPIIAHQNILTDSSKEQIASAFANLFVTNNKN